MASNGNNLKLNMTKEPSLDELSKYEFLSYASSVIYSRAIPLIEDGLKPIHRRILYTLYKTKLTSDKEPKKSMATVGEVLKLSPHGDSATYEAMVRLSQWWKMRYPLVEMQGNCGNLLGDPAAAARYTNTHLSKIGDLMLEDINKDAVDFRPNYDESMDEPITLPCRFPNILCNPSSGIAVGISSDLAAHNFTEVMGAIEYYLTHGDNDTTIDNILEFIKGPDYPTGGTIYTTYQDLKTIYGSGRGSFKIFANYDISKKSNGQVVVTFHDIPYGTTIDGGVKAVLHKMVLDDGITNFESIDTQKVGPYNFDIIITLAKGTNVGASIELLYNKTHLCSSAKINQTFIVDGEPRTLSLLDMIKRWCKYRSSVIQRIATKERENYQSKLTIILGLEKCTSNIDLLISIVRNATSRSDAAAQLMKAFEITSVQADAVLDMKLSKLNKLDIQELVNEQKELDSKIADATDIIDNANRRNSIIIEQLHEIKQMIGEDKRRTKIVIQDGGASAAVSDRVQQEWLIYEDGLHGTTDGKLTITNNLVDAVIAYDSRDIYCYDKEGNFGSLAAITSAGNLIAGATVNSAAATKVIVVTKNGNIKVSDIGEYAKIFEKGKIDKLLKLKDGDAVLTAAIANDNDYVLILAQDHVVKLAVAELPVASKLTVGVKSGYSEIDAAVVTNDASKLLLVTTGSGKAQGKLTTVKDFSTSKRGAQGQNVPEGTIFMHEFPDARQHIYVTLNNGNLGTVVDRNKISLKGRTAVGASLVNRAVSSIKTIL